MKVQKNSKKFIALASSLAIVTTGIIGGAVYASADKNPSTEAK